jgi:hypothetical protein
MEATLVSTNELFKLYLNEMAIQAEHICNDTGKQDYTKAEEYFDLITQRAEKKDNPLKKYTIEYNGLTMIPNYERKYFEIANHYTTQDLDI